MSPTKEECDYSKGDRIGLSFDVGKIDHPVYGKADGLHGVMNYLCRYGDYTIPAIATDPVGREKVIDELFEEFKFMWENDTDDLIKDRLRDYIVFASYLNPCHDHFTKKTQAIATTLACAFAGDDIADQFEDISEAGFGFIEIEKMFKYVHDATHGVYASPDEIPNTFPAFTPVTKGFWKSQARWFDAIPDYLKKCEPLMQSVDCAFLSLALLKEHTKPGEKFSERSWKLFSDHNTGMLILLEAVLLARGICLNHKVAQDILIQNMRTQVGSVSSLLNSILGLLKDIRLDEVLDSHILRQVCIQGKSLQDAFDYTFTMFREELDDIRVGAIKLRQRYAHNQSVLDWVRACEDLIDGQFYWYSQCVRYGKLGFKIIKVEDPHA